MKIKLDIDKLLQEEKITEEEYSRLLKFSAEESGSLAFNILVGFGVIAVGGAILGLMQSVWAAIALGLCTLYIGMALNQEINKQWSVLSAMCIATGAVVFGGGIIYVSEGAPSSMVAIAAVFGFTGALSNSALLVVFSILSISSAIGARTGYMHASYFMGIKEPLLTVVIFSILSVMFYLLSIKYRASKYERPSIIAARTSVFLVNLGFWVGSLWVNRSGTIAQLSSNYFSVLWAIALISIILWSWKNNRQWVLNTGAVFGGIHFYTQYFERLHTSLGSVLVAGLLAMAFASILRSVNSNMPQIPNKASKPTP